ncbi:MAG: bactofilin family protein [Bacteroidota bacterium]
MKSRYLTLFLLFALLLIPTTAVHAQGVSTDGGRVIFGSNFTVKSGDEFNGDLVVFGGNVTVEPDATLNGNLVVFGGTVSSQGKVKGDVVAIGGQVKLEEQAVVTGDVVTIGGQVQQAQGATVMGDVVNNVSPEIQLPNGTMSPDVNTPRVHLPAVINTRFNPFWEFVRVLGSALVVAFLGALAAMFFQPQLDRISQAAVRQPVMTTSIGLLTFVVLFIAAITIILIPVVLLSLIPLAFAWLFGIISIGQEIGDRFARATRQNWTPVIATGVGTFALVFIVASIQSLNSLAPFLLCGTLIVPILVGLLAIGAVVITRFGTRPVQSPALTVYPPADSGPVPPAS